MVATSSCCGGSGESLNGRLHAWIGTFERTGFVGVVPVAAIEGERSAWEKVSKESREGEEERGGRRKRECGDGRHGQGEARCGFRGVG